MGRTYQVTRSWEYFALGPGDSVLLESRPRPRIASRTRNQGPVASQPPQSKLAVTAQLVVGRECPDKTGEPCDPEV